MPIPNHPDQKQNKGIQKASFPFLPISLISLVLTAAIAGTGLFFSPSVPAVTAVNQQTTTQSPAVQPSSPLQSPPAAPIQPQASLTVPQPVTATAQAIEEQVPVGDGLPEETGEPAVKILASDKLSAQQQQCSQLAGRLHTFFKHLDQQEYIQEFQLGAPAQQYFLALATKLLNQPPIVSRESDDLYTILKNMAHFFRVIGGKNIVIIKGILDRERDAIEDVAADLFLWTTGEQCHDDGFSFQAPLDKLYEYAGFFLNSMGGRSYLFRRDSRSRLLVNYYSILLINRANLESINRHGVDIKPLLPVTINEIESSNQLIYKEKYLDDLYELTEKYQ